MTCDEGDFELSERLGDLFLFLRVTYVERRDVAALCCACVVHVLCMCCSCVCVRVDPGCQPEVASTPFAERLAFMPGRLVRGNFKKKITEHLKKRRAWVPVAA